MYAMFYMHVYMYVRIIIILEYCRVRCTVV